MHNFSQQYTVSDFIVPTKLQVGTEQTGLATMTFLFVILGIKLLLQNNQHQYRDHG